MSIINKLNLTKYKNLTVLNQPADYVVFNECKSTLSGDHDAIFIFIKTLDEMVKYTQQIINEQQKHVKNDKNKWWIFWPKVTKQLIYIAKKRNKVTATPNLHLFFGIRSASGVRPDRPKT